MSDRPTESRIGASPREIIAWRLWTADGDGIDDFDLAAALRCPMMGLYRESRGTLARLIKEAADNA